MSGIWSSLLWDGSRGRLMVTDVSGQRIGPIFKNQAVQEELDCLTLEDGTDTWSRNVGKQTPTYAAQHPGWTKTSVTLRCNWNLCLSWLILLSKVCAFNPLVILVFLIWCFRVRSATSPSNFISAVSVFTRYHKKNSKSGYLLRHACLSAWNNSAPTGRIFMKFDIWGFFANLSWKFKFD
jgi:hypothetical protein